RRLTVFAGADQPGEFRRAGHVRALADHLEIAVRANGQHFEAGELRKALVNFGNRTGRESFYGRGDLSDVIRRRAAAPSDDVHETVRREFPKRCGGVWRLLVVLSEGVRQARVGITRDVTVGNAREFGHVLPHVAGAERAVDADAERPG